MARMDDHAKKPVPQVSEISRRSFMKSVAVTGALLTATALGVGAFPKIANAQDEFVQIAGQQVKVVKLTKRLDVLDRETQPYRTGPGAGETFRPDGSYGLSVAVPREVTFLVTLNKPPPPKSMVRSSGIAVLFPKEKDSPIVPADERGIRGSNIDDFTSLVKKVTNQNLSRVQIILDKTTFDYNGNEAQYYQAYILPIDAQGNRTTSRGPGKYLAYKAGYYYYNGGADGGNEGIVLLSEPNVHGPIARR